MNGTLIMSNPLPDQNIDSARVDMSKEAIERCLELTFPLSDLRAERKQAGLTLMPPTTSTPITSPPESM